MPPIIAPDKALDGSIFLSTLEKVNRNMIAKAVMVKNIENVPIEYMSGDKKYKNIVKPLPKKINFSVNIKNEVLKIGPEFIVLPV